MIPKSIKWRLQLWYGLIFVVVLVGFGFTAYQLERGRQMRRIDDELHRRVGILANALHHPPPPRPEMGEQLLSRPPRGQILNDHPPRSPLFQKDRPLPEFGLPPEDARFFDASDPHKYNFINAVPLKSPVNIDDFLGRVMWGWAEVEQVPVKWAFSRRG